MSSYLLLLTLLILATLAPQGANGLFGNPNWTLDKVLDVAISRLIGQKSEDSSLTPEHYREFLLQDESNEDLALASAQEIIARSGYQYENHYVVSDDGYITNLVRIVNPLADRSQLKQPPVMMMHGGIIDNTVWVWSSAIQHHPEKYPRVAEDGPITSWNKSLGFVLANNGYDVWLVGTRGSNIQNKGHVSIKHYHNWFDHQQLAKLKGKQPDMNFQMNFKQNFKYWNFTMDDIGRFEFTRQQEKILQLTGSKKVTWIDFSFSTLIGLPLMCENAQFVSRLHNYVRGAPILTNRGTNLFMRTFHETICTRLPMPIGTILAQLILSPPVRAFVVSMSSSKQLRYSMSKQITRLLAGPSAQYETNLDSGVLGHIFLSTGYKQLRHYCQQVLAGQPQKYDLGAADNMRHYGSPQAPKYDLAKITNHPNWMLFSGGNDMLATVESIKQLLNSVNRQPTRHVHIKRYNHLDLIAGVENDILINLPILNFLDEFALIPRGEQQKHVEENQID